MFRGLDWTPSSININFRDHWRLLLCLVLGMCCGTLIWHLYFPPTFWFIKFWNGLATGMALGIVPGAWWQLCSEERRSITSGRFIVTGIVAWGAFAACSFFLWIPELRSQEGFRAHLRSLSAETISSVSVRVDYDDYQDSWHTEDKAVIGSFVACARQAELFYPSHERSLAELQITIFRNDGTWVEYNGRIPERNSGDLSLDFRGYVVWTEVIIPNGGQWLALSRKWPTR